jgi:multisubunit Na+/H+ antiporter MnhB subunit
MKRISALVGVLFTLAIGPTAAMASSSTCQAYNEQTCVPVTTTATTSSAGTLPFTGLDVVLLVAGGGVLLAGGFAVRRLSRRLN